MHRLRTFIRNLSFLQFLAYYLSMLFVCGGAMGYFTIGQASGEIQAMVGISNAMSPLVWWLNVIGIGTLIVSLSMVPGIMLMRPTLENEYLCSKCGESCKLK